MTRHKHEWVRADDWEFGPGKVAFECFPCRSLIVTSEAEAAKYEQSERYVSVRDTMLRRAAGTLEEALG